MTSLHREIHFEDETRRHIPASGWLYEENDASRNDRARASSTSCWGQRISTRPSGPTRMPDRGETTHFIA